MSTFDYTQSYREQKWQRNPPDFTYCVRFDSEGDNIHGSIVVMAVWWTGDESDGHGLCEECMDELCKSGPMEKTGPT